MLAEPATALHPALVVLINNQRDWQRVTDEGWYRIPIHSAPQPLAADYLAFYQTRAFGAESWQVACYAAVQRYRIMQRRDLLPDEPQHARADHLYYRIDVGAVQRLARPIPSRRLRRITFIPTTWERLNSAEDVADLWQIDDATAILWQFFRDAALKATHSLALDLHENG